MHILKCIFIQYPIIMCEIVSYYFVYYLNFQRMLTVALYIVLIS